MLCSLLGTKKLPEDYYAIYKNITKFSTWKLESILKLNDLPNSTKGIKELNKFDQALSLEQFKKYKKEFIKSNPENFGIPQGSSISSVFSNIYMLEFDKKINDYICYNNGLYMRYSDDFIIILPKIDEIIFKRQFEYIKNIIMSIPKLVLQPDKTQIYKYENSSLLSCNELVLENMKNSRNLLNYLGFTFDGKIVSIRDKTLSKYYYRMYRKLKTIVKCNGKTRYGNKISFKNIYDKYSIKGSHKGNGNFITYVKRAEGVFGKHEAINRGTYKHMQKIRSKLNLIKKLSQ